MIVLEIAKLKKKLNVKSLYLYEIGLLMIKSNNNLLPANFNYYLKTVK